MNVISSYKCSRRSRTDRHFQDTTRLPCCFLLYPAEDQLQYPSSEFSSVAQLIPTTAASPIPVLPTSAAATTTTASPVPVSPTSAAATTLRIVQGSLADIQVSSDRKIYSIRTGDDHFSFAKLLSRICGVNLSIWRRLPAAAEMSSIEVKMHAAFADEVVSIVATVVFLSRYNNTFDFQTAI